MTSEGIFESVDYGSTWAFNSKGIKAHNISALAANDTYLFTGTSENGIFRSSDNGATWTPIGISSTDLNSKSINDIIVIDNTIFAATSAGITIMAYWLQLLEGPGYTFLQIWEKHGHFLLWKGLIQQK